MAYSELIKNFAKIREYVSQFYIYGFKSRNEYTAKSARSYDNERRRIESWLGEYMQFRQNKSGKSSFLALDSRAISHNPLYNAFKAKSFTENDINLHFYILDILAEGEERSLREIIDSITDDYLYAFENAGELDESTIRKKLKEYEKLGIIKSRKHGKELLYSRNDCSVDLESWKYAAAYFSEEDPLVLWAPSSLINTTERPIFSRLSTIIFSTPLKARSLKLFLRRSAGIKKRSFPFTYRSGTI